VRTGPPELIAALKEAYQAQETKPSEKTMLPGCKYGATDNFVACQQRGLQTHMGDG
jgi:hypothetical protein